MRFIFPNLWQSCDYPKSRAIDGGEKNDRAKDAVKRVKATIIHQINETTQCARNMTRREQIIHLSLVHESKRCDVFLLMQTEVKVTFCAK